MELLVNGKVTQRYAGTARRFGVQTWKHGKAMTVQVRAYDRAQQRPVRPGPEVVPLTPVNSRVMSTPRPVLVVDFGAQYAQLIARRVREARVYSEIVPHSMPVAEMLARNPAAIILSGGPSSVYEPGAPSLDPALFDNDVPVFGICYGFQAMAQALGGTVAHSGAREYGRTVLTPLAEPGTLLRELPADLPVWMSHGDAVTEAPAGYAVTASSAERAGGRVREPGDPPGGRAVPPRGGAHPAGAGDAPALPLRHRRHRADLDVLQHHRRPGRRDPRAGRRQAGHLRPVRRRRLGGGRGAGAQGDRRPAHLRLRRPRAAACRRGRAGREGLRRGDRHPPQGRRRRRVLPGSPG
nr:hypothetical protein GCM10020092_098540 [Actinoplanes digitatis]